MIDCISSAPKYRAHLGPLWDALPAELRGEWLEVDAQRGTAPRFRPAAPRASRPARDRAALVAGYMDYRTARRRGYRLIAYLEHGIGQTYGTNDPHLPGGADRDAIGLFLSPNEHAAGKDRAAYPRARVEVIGAPRLDSLPARRDQPDVPVVAVSFHWHRTKVPEMRSALDYYTDALAELADRQPWPLLGHSHPQAEDARILWRVLDVEYEADWDEVLRSASVFVADNTSALYEFAATGRPVVVLNDSEYRRDVEHGLRFWEAATVGVQVNEPADLEHAIGEAMRDSDVQAKAREAALDVVYARRSGASTLGAEVLADWLTEATARR